MSDFDERLELSFVAQTPEEAAKKADQWAAREPKVERWQVGDAVLMRQGTWLYRVPVDVAWEKEPVQ